jgi:hypothetical protein
MSNGDGLNRTRARGRTRRRGDLWPWTAKAAILLVPVILLVLLTAAAVISRVAAWPEHRYDGLVLWGVFILSLIPVVLLLIETLARLNASITLPGVALSFAGASESAAATVRTATLAENLGTSEDTPLAQDSLRSVLSALRRAHDSEVTVVDLRQGNTWWETRLFLLIAGAARRDRPSVIAFIGDRNGRPGSFLGWASPSKLLEMLLAVSPVFAKAHEKARAATAQWLLGTDGRQDAAGARVVTLPWNSAQFMLPRLVDESPDPAFAFELFLQQSLDQNAALPPQHVNIQRLLLLFEPVLVTDALDVAADDKVWAGVIATSPNSYFAVTRAGQLRSLVPRDALVATLVARLVAAQDDVSDQPQLARR